MHDISCFSKPLLGRYYVRSMTNGDLRAVEAIEKTSKENFWTIDDFRKTIACHGVMGNVFIENNRIVAFYIYEFDGSDVHILNFVVHPDHRRHGLGSAMIGVLKNRLNEDRIHLRCNVRESNLSSQLFLRKNGFLANKVDRNYFVDYYMCGGNKAEDAYCFQYTGMKNE